MRGAGGRTLRGAELSASLRPDRLHPKPSTVSRAGAFGPQNARGNALERALVAWRRIHAIVVHVSAGIRFQEKAWWGSSPFRTWPWVHAGATAAFPSSSSARRPPSRQAEYYASFTRNINRRNVLKGFRRLGRGRRRTPPWSRPGSSGNRPIK